MSITAAPSFDNSTTDSPICRGGTISVTFTATSGCGEQFPMILPPSISNAWQKRETSQDRGLPIQMKYGLGKKLDDICVK
jgi:hypothetical protein